MLIVLILVVFNLNFMMLSFLMGPGAHGAMRFVMWQKDQKSVCAMSVAIVREAQT